MTRLGPCRERISGDRHTDTHTDTQTKYSNPRCACAPRVNNYCGGAGINRYGMIWKVKTWRGCLPGDARKHCTSWVYQPQQEILDRFPCRIIFALSPQLNSFSFMDFLCSWILFTYTYNCLFTCVFVVLLVTQLPGNIIMFLYHYYFCLLISMLHGYIMSPEQLNQEMYRVVS